MKKFLALLLVLVLGITAGVGGTIAYLTDTEEAVNVMTVGNVEIAQHEYEREVKDGDYTTKEIDGVKSYVLKEFTQAKPLLPIVGDPSLPGDNPEYAGWDAIPVRMSQVNSYGGMQVFAGKNAQDKFVTVENTGDFDAYVRTIVAIEVGTANAELIGTSYHGTWTKNEIGTVAINGNNYVVIEYTYAGAKLDDGSWRHEGGKLPAGETSYPNLSQVYLSSEATNEDVNALDGNENGTIEILVLSQAVQADGFADVTDDAGKVVKSAAEVALDAAFSKGNNNENVVTWLAGLKIPTVFAWEGVNYVTEGETVKVNANGGDTVYRGIVSEGATAATEVVIGEGITRLNDRALCKAPNLTAVTLPDSLTYIDEGVFQQSGFVEITVPENVTYIGKQAFGACGSLEKIVIKAKDVTIANYVARACANLKEVYIYSDSVTFETGSMYFTNTENADASAITFYVPNQAIADTCYAAFSTSHSYGMLIKSLDGNTTYYNTLKG